MQLNLIFAGVLPQQRGLTTHSTGARVSLPLIENLSVSAVRRAWLIRALGVSISPARQLMHTTLPSFKSRIDEIKRLILGLQVAL
jgi:hypothetical protein